MAGAEHRLELGSVVLTYPSMSANPSAFTDLNAWRGGSFELYVATQSSAQLGSLVSAIWSYPDLQGCYRRHDIEPESQPRIEPSVAEMSGHLYGLASLSNGKVVPCGTFVIDYEGEDGSSPAHSVSFAIAMGALATAYPVGAYPFGSMSEVASWKREVEAFFVSVATHAYGIAPFPSALVGFEVTPIRLTGSAGSGVPVPAEREHGMLVATATGLLWHPATYP